MRSILIQLTTLAVGASQLAAAQQAPPQSAAALPPVRSIGRTIASSTELLGAVSQARALSDGRVLVNDNAGRKVVLFDKTLQAFTVVADTTSATGNAYSSRAAGLIAYKGDTTLLVDPQSLSMLVLDGRGQVIRVMSIPRPNEANLLVGGPNGTPGFDAQGRLVYRAPPDMQPMIRAMQASGGPGTPGFVMPTRPESMTVIRVNLETRGVDTVGAVKISVPKMNVTTAADGRATISSITNPMQYIDDWAVTSDGRVVLARGQEYRLDYMDADDKVETSSKLPFAWRKLTDSMKIAFLDSAKAASARMREQAIQRMQQGAAGAPIAMMPPGGAGAVEMGARVRVAERAVVAGGDRPGAAGGAGRGAAGNQTFTIPEQQFVQPNELPDYAPPFTAGAVRGDADGNIWIRTSNIFNNGYVYDVVNSKGVLTDRVLLPPGRVIAGFGKGVVFMGFRDGAGVRLEMAAIREPGTVVPNY